MYEIPDLVELLKTGAHFGHQVSKWHPKMKPFLFGSRNGIHIINLEATVEKLKVALDAARDITAKGGVIVFLGTKRQASGIVEKYAKECGAPYITTRWLGGTFTNFPEISKLIKKLNEYRAKTASGGFDKYTKKERVIIDREIADMERKVGGIASLTKLPDALYVVDAKHEKTAVEEAGDKKVPIFAMLDSNINPEDIAYGIPANDDAVKSIELITRLMAEAVNEGRKLREKELASKKVEAAKAAPSAEEGAPSRIITA
ncbi:MAG TPA: 30S ribosomal protein S2 [Candidatus Baltobacteraceae bacterium]|nr:30S ribosomal protein S2 [Candidatus Baltobacteraceae bacterium]